MASSVSLAQTTRTSLATSFTPSERATILHLIEISLAEDVGSGDVTTCATIPIDATANAKFLAKQNGVLSGLAVSELVFHTVDKSLKVEWTHCDGDRITKGTQFGTVSGPAHSILVAERLALNIMQRMSGIASATCHMCDLIARSSSPTTRLLDTRKTAPGMRLLDKMAVRHGGGVNHRIGLYDMFLIKDNHIDTCGGITRAIDAAHAYRNAEPLTRAHLQIEIEARTLSDVEEILQRGGVDRILLDNMVKVSYDENHSLLIDTSLLSRAVQLVNKRIACEASGNVNEQTIIAIANTAVDYISVGALTHSVSALDISLKITEILTRGTIH